MNPQQLRTLVFEKTGIKVDVDDPIFALVALNEAVLAEAVERHIARIDAASQELAQQLRQTGNPPHAIQHEHERHPGFTPAPAAGPVKPIATQAPLLVPRELRLLGAAALVALLSASLVLAGQALFSKPAELDPQQRAALAKGEKLEKILPALPPATRATVEAALRQP
ncbi:hypothetical protein MJ904_03405 [Massilia sp. MB5]|uniref:hypothetical protein n=1 Tax=Massilia sp. MB5 TaxID=2919578 RepID=UPI001F0D7C07|nr:hypothetical protein [Massilia sp. MB5]UMR31303.1 hypothetical protein MJ904_03405 [Massilia sp. MB5]